LLFRKIEDAEVLEQVEKLKKASEQHPAAGGSEATNAGKIVSSTAIGAATAAATSTAAPAEAPKAQIVYEDFARLELKVGTILTAEKVEKADKLLKLGVDLGDEQRTIVSGIAQHFRPEEITGKQVVVVTNLAPRKMRGIESNGMILMAEDRSGKLHFVSPEDKIEPGSGVS
jgi:methionyl-tRNA synthetase